MRLKFKSAVKRRGATRETGTQRGQGLASLYAYLRKQRVRKTQPGALGRLGWTIFWSLATVGLLWFSGRWALRVLLFENPRYNLAHVDIEVVGKIPRHQVLEWAQIPGGANLLALRLGDVHGRLVSQSAVGFAEVRRVMPNRLQIRVTERRPAARLLTTGGVAPVEEDVYYIIDRQGMVMRPRPGEDFRHLPEISGANLMDVVVGSRVKGAEVFAALNLLTLMEASPIWTEFDRIGIDVSRENLLLTRLGRDARVVFSPDPAVMPEQLRRLEVILSYCQRGRQRLATADLTVERNVPVTFLASGG